MDDDLDAVLASIRPVDPSAVPEGFADFVRSSIDGRPSFSPSENSSRISSAGVVEYDLADLIGDP
jgi:hypothetical protein